jgi:hypothetical protein
MMEESVKRGQESVAGLILGGLHFVIWDRCQTKLNRVSAASAGGLSNNTHLNMVVHLHQLISASINTRDQPTQTPKPTSFPPFSPSTQLLRSISPSTLPHPPPLVCLSIPLLHFNQLLLPIPQLILT